MRVVISPRYFADLTPVTTEKVRAAIGVSRIRSEKRKISLTRYSPPMPPRGRRTDPDDAFAYTTKVVQAYDACSDRRVAACWVPPLLARPPRARRSMGPAPAGAPWDLHPCRVGSTGRVGGARLAHFYRYRITSAVCWLHSGRSRHTADERCAWRAYSRHQRKRVIFSIQYCPS